MAYISGRITRYRSFLAGTFQSMSVRIDPSIFEFTPAANSRSMAQTPEQQRGALFDRLRMELMLISLRASGARLTGKHWATPFTGSLTGAGPQRNSSPRGPRARRLLVCLAWDLSSLTPSPRASLLARPQDTVTPVFPARCH